MRSTQGQLLWSPSIASPPWHITRGQLTSAARTLPTTHRWCAIPFILHGQEGGIIPSYSLSLRSWTFLSAATFKAASISMLNLLTFHVALEVPPTAAASIVIYCKLCNAVEPSRVLHPNILYNCTVPLQCNELLC